MRSYERRPETTKDSTDCQLLTVKDVAGLLKIHAGTIWRLVALAETGHNGFPKPLRLGPKTIRWRLDDVQAYLTALAGEVVE